jgi:hypothetical protein
MDKENVELTDFYSPIGWKSRGIHYEDINWEAEKICGARMKNNKVEHLVKFKGCNKRRLERFKYCYSILILNSI